MSTTRRTVLAASAAAGIAAVTAGTAHAHTPAPKTGNPPLPDGSSAAPGRPPGSTRW